MWCTYSVLRKVYVFVFVYYVYKYAVVVVFVFVDTVDVIFLFCVYVCISLNDEKYNSITAIVNLRLSKKNSYTSGQTARL